MISAIFGKVKNNSAGGIVQLIAVGDMGRTIPNEANNRLLGKPHRIGNQVKYLTQSCGKKSHDLKNLNLSLLLWYLNPTFLFQS